jgi:hypothetical protein
MAITRSGFLPIYIDYSAIEGLLKYKVGDEYKYGFAGNKISTKNLVNTDQPIPVIYGHQKLQPSRVLTTVNPDNPQFLYVAYVIAEGPLLGLRGLSIDGNDIDLANEIATGSIASGVEYAIDNFSANPTYANNVKFQWFDGASSNPLSTLLDEGLIGNLPVYQDISYLVMRFRYVEKGPFKSIPEIGVEVVGKQVDKYGVDEYSTNPADILYDFLTNSNYGKGIDSSAIDTTSFQTARNWFAKTEPLIRNTPVQPQFSCNTQIDQNKPINTVIQELLQNFNMALPYYNGTYTCVAEYPTSFGGSSQMTFNEDNIIGEVQISYPNEKTVVNKLNVEFKDGDNNFEPVTTVYPGETDVDTQEGLRELDGNRLLEGTMTMPFVTNKYMALNLAQIAATKLRNQIFFKFKTFKDAYQLSVGDLVTLDLNISSSSSDELGNNTLVRISKIILNTDLSVDIECYSHDDAWFDYTKNRYLRNYQPVLPTPIGLPPAQNPPISEAPPEDATLPGIGDPGGPSVPTGSLPVTGYTHTVSGMSTMSDNERFYLGEVNTQTPLQFYDTDAYPDGCRIMPYNPTAGTNEYKDTESTFSIYPQICIYDRNHTIGTSNNRDLYWTFEWTTTDDSRTLYGFQDVPGFFDTNSGTYTYNWDPEAYTNGSIPGVSLSNPKQNIVKTLQPLDVYYLQQCKFRTDGTGNYYSYPRIPDPFNSPVPYLILPESGPVYNIPFRLGARQEQDPTLGIKIWELESGVIKYVGQFTIDFQLTNIHPDKIRDARTFYTKVNGRTPGF